MSSASRQAVRDERSGTLPCFFGVNPDKEPQTRHSQRLPTLLSALHLLYVGRALAGFVADEQSPRPPVDLNVVDATIEAFTDEICATELLHEAALLVGDVER